MANKISAKTRDQIGGMLRTGEACRILYVSGNTLRRWNKLGLINAYRVGPRGDRRFRLEDVNALLAQEIKLNSGLGAK
jgi:excisionase family DNA binding protein